jgi:predicted phage terminase large subunit-like protein
MNPRQQALVNLAEKCRWDLFFFAKYILHYDLLEEQVHGDVCKYAEALYPAHPDTWIPPEDKEGKGLEDQFHNGNTNQLYLLPRGSFKSSLITIAFTLQNTLHDPNIRILIDSETFSKSKAFLAEIKGHLESNEEFREIFKTIHGMYPNEGRKKELLWTDSQLNLACRNKPRKEPTISCAGIDVTKNGMHYDLAICDDLHSEQNVTNKEQIDKVKDHWKLIYSLLDPGRPLIVIGTRWHFDDLYQLILDEHREEFNIIVRRAILDNGEAWFPSRLSIKELTSIRNKQGSAHFSRQYQNEPIDDETATFKHKDFHRKKWDEVKDLPINWCLAIDPSYEGTYSDYAAFVLAGMDYQRNLYVRHITRQKMTYSGIINEAFRLFAEFQPRQVVIETVGAQKSIMHEFNNEQKRRGTWLPLQEVKQRTLAKEERIRALAPFYEYSHVYHITECPQLDELEYELLRFPSAKHDDVVDAFATTLDYLSAPNPKVWQRKDTDEDDPRSRRRSPYKPRISKITGY